MAAKMAVKLVEKMAANSVALSVVWTAGHLVYLWAACLAGESAVNLVGRWVARLAECSALPMAALWAAHSVGL